jgi:hypothetical protein
VQYLREEIDFRIPRKLITRAEWSAANDNEDQERRFEPRPTRHRFPVPSSREHPEITGDVVEADQLADALGLNDELPGGG